MDWYEYYRDRVRSLELPEVYGYRELYIALCLAIAESDFSTKEDFKNLTRAFIEYEEEVLNESITTTVSKSTAI